MLWIFKKLAADEQDAFERRSRRNAREARRKTDSKAASTRDNSGPAWLDGTHEWVSMGELAPGDDLDAIMGSLQAGELYVVPSSIQRDRRFSFLDLAILKTRAFSCAAECQ